MRFLTALAAVLLSVSVVQAEGLHDLITRKAQQHGLPTGFAHAIVRIESRYQPHVTSRGGHIGLGQISYRTAKSLGFRGTLRQLYDPETNLEYSFRYLRLAYDMAGKDDCLAASKYNAGLAHKRRVRSYCNLL